MRRKLRPMLRAAAGDSSPVPPRAAVPVACAIRPVDAAPSTRAGRGPLWLSIAAPVSPTAAPSGPLERPRSRLRASRFAAPGKVKPSLYASLLAEPALAAFARSAGLGLGQGGHYCPRFVDPDRGHGKRRSWRDEERGDILQAAVAQYCAYLLEIRHARR